MVRAFANGLWDWGSIVGLTKTMPFTGSIIKWRSRKSGVNLGKEWRPPLHLSVFAKEKGVFGLPSTTIALFLLHTFITEILFLQETDIRNISH